MSVSICQGLSKKRNYLGSQFNMAWFIAFLQENDLIGIISTFQSKQTKQLVIEISKCFFVHV